MHNTSTPDHITHNASQHISTQTKSEAPAPRRQTIEFLRQFARAYTVMPVSTAALSGFIAN